MSNAEGSERPGDARNTMEAASDFCLRHSFVIRHSSFVIVLGPWSLVLVMRFLAPIAFWFAAAIPAVILFYLLKRKRQVRLVSSTLLWQKFLAETQASAPFQRLRHNWLLILQLLMLALAIFALARPYFLVISKSCRMRVVILDDSSSMQRSDDKSS